MIDRGFKFVPSHTYFFMLIPVLFFSGILLLIMDISWLLKIAAIIVFVIYSFHLIYNVSLLRGNKAIQSIRFHEDGQWRITDSNGDFPAKLLGDSVVTAWVSVLRFQEANKRWPRSCVVFRDSLPRGEYRQMIMQLSIN